MLKKLIALLILLFFIPANATIMYNKSIVRKSKYTIVNDNLLKALNNKDQNWHYKDIRKLTKVLLVGEKEFKINHKIVLGIISLESGFKKTAHNKNKKSVDNGLGQINNKNWNRLSRASIKVLKKYKISYVNHKYNIALNVMNCFVHLNDNRKELKRKNKLTVKTWIQSYNCGVRGTLTPDFVPIQKENYWKVFLFYYRAI